MYVRTYQMCNIFDARHWQNFQQYLKQSITLNYTLCLYYIGLKKSEYSESIRMQNLIYSNIEIYVRTILIRM